MLTSWRTRAEQYLIKSWLHRGFLALALTPVAEIFRLLSALQRQLFTLGVCKSTRLNARVIVVGNVVAGGAGKTPTVIAIAEQLTKDGYRVGIISRGYGRKSIEIKEVFSDASAADVGDEPLLMHKRLALPTFVGRDRVTVAQRLLQTYPQVNTIVCDDGIQHLALYRDVEVYVFDNRGTGNGLPLPAGPLRSPWPPQYVASSGQSAASSIVLHSGSDPAFAGHIANRTLAPFGLRCDGSNIPLNDLQHSTKPLIAIAGIAQPEAFFQMLSATGLQTLKNVAYPDHYDFSSWIAPDPSKYIILCTEKDAVKIWQLEPSAIAIPLTQTMDTPFFMQIRQKLGTPSPSLAGYH